MTSSLGILAYGSLIDQPGAEIREGTVRILRDGIKTPFNVEFARTSQRREGAPTLVPVDSGGASVAAIIFVMNVSEEEAAHRLWRREINKVGNTRLYTPKANPGPDDVIVKRLIEFAGMNVVLYTKIGANIAPLTPQTLARLAIRSARALGDERDGISYLIATKGHGIKTALSEAYEEEVLRQTRTSDLAGALAAIRSAVNLSAGSF